MDDMLTEPFRRLLAGIATPAMVRADEAVAGVAPCWAEIGASGFLDALVPEAAGGAGLTLADVFPLVVACGEHALPAPVAETMAARALLAARGVPAPDDAAIVLAPPSAIVPLAAKASHALVPRGERLALVAMGEVAADPFGLGGGTLCAEGETVCEVAGDGIDLLAWAAALTAAAMAGAMARMLDMSLTYANERRQFGKPLAAFQAIQHQLAVAAEEAVAANVAARIGMSGRHFDPLRAAMAKARTGEAAERICAIAHAVHGAIGVTEEYDLQLYSRRLKQWRLAFGGETYWAGRIGAARLVAPGGTSADFIRLNLQDGD
jgi:acyl-CoA dehydrogenase